MKRKLAYDDVIMLTLPMSRSKNNYISLDGVRDLEALILSDKSSFERFCHGCAPNDPCEESVDALDPVLNSLSLMDEEFSKVIDTTEIMSDIIACERVNSIYIDLVHGATCSDITYALTWMFAMLLFFSCFGLLIVTFRAAILPPKKSSDYNAEQQEERGLDNSEPPYAVQTGTSFQEETPKSESFGKEECSDTASSVLTTERDEKDEKSYSS